ncbi:MULTISPECIES: carbohydrate ABC transporter permease [Paenibacillus]|uniref:Raffinose/stachyose/melibiose transport system permease protein n=2 Tax=Paenibacillus TaxID=44249 RepID=A0A1H8PGD2_9BACL|nr:MULTISPECIES: sugar ABC transporter permease [Paenibacillus]QWU16564.1 sugar ABC transporter permease [Paenibacillus sophorae]RQW11231.1 sugar ABC transporter permease [Paenibacillus rhizophilus]SEO40861.1 raffinose/stachyose/melibiose transport system permease protein [Paenibacillus sophorae]
MNRVWSSSIMQQIVFMGPFVVLFILITAIPFTFGIYYSFTDWNGLSDKLPWVGIDNYKFIFTNDTAFIHSLWFTIRFTIVSVILCNVIGFIIAYFLSKPLKSRNVLRTLFFMPNVIGGIILGFIWLFIYTQGFSTIGEYTGIAFFNLPWLGTETTAFWALVIVFVWQGVGYIMVYYIAGLANVPQDLIEAATIDGAKTLQILRNIIFPMIMPSITVCIFISTVASFKSFDLNYSLTKGGPFLSTESVAMNIYTEAFAKNNMGLGAAKAIVFFFIVMIISIIQVYLTKKREVQV